MKGLDTRILKEARIAVIKNGRSLVEEAEILRHRKYARAYALAHIAWEEVTKAPEAAWEGHA
jgi:AbiV family abortive infection protein